MFTIHLFCPVSRITIVRLLTFEGFLHTYRVQEAHKLIWCTLLVQRASYLALHSSLFGPDHVDGAVNYDYIVTNSINCNWYSQLC